MKPTQGSVREYLMLFRVRFCPSTFVVPISGALAVGMTDITHLGLLFFLGCLTHIRGYAGNDYFDRSFDRQSQFVDNRPIAKGTISMRTVKIIMLASLFFYWLIVCIFFFNPGTVGMAVGGPLFGFLYNAFGKKVAGSDLFLAMSIFCHTLMGAFSAGGGLSPMVLAVGLLWFLEIIFFNPMMGLKDLEFDRRSGARTLPLLLGVMQPDEKIDMAFRFRFIMSLILLLQTCTLGFIVFLSSFKTVYSQSIGLKIFFVYAFGVLITSAAVIFLQKSVSLKKNIRVSVIQYFSLYYIVIVLLYPLSGISLTLVFVLLFPVWAIIFNILTYGKAAQEIAPRQESFSNSKHVE